MLTEGSPFAATQPTLQLPCNQKGFIEDIPLVLCDNVCSFLNTFDMWRLALCSAKQYKDIPSVRVDALEHVCLDSILRVYGDFNSLILSDPWESETVCTASLVRFL